MGSLGTHKSQGAAANFGLKTKILMSVSTFFSSLTYAKQLRTIERPVQRQPNGKVQRLIFLFCTLLPDYVGN